VSWLLTESHKAHVARALKILSEALDATTDCLKLCVIGGCHAVALRLRAQDHALSRERQTQNAKRQHRAFTRDWVGGRSEHTSKGTRAFAYLVQC
jgi:hypothetical protein